MKERIQKIMAQAGLGSRRHNEDLIRSGRVRLNGRVAILGDKADLAHDEIEVDGKAIALKRAVYIMLNKPKGVLSSTEDELGEGRTTIRDLVSVGGHLYPVGRLDKQSQGLILLTNDGGMAHKLTHPRYEHSKVYHVLVEGHPTRATIELWASGVDLEGRVTAPAGVEVLEKKRDETWLRITMREGRKRQIRRVATLLEHPVVFLNRLQIGPLHLDKKLKAGQWRYLTDAEVALLQAAQAIEPGARRSDERRPKGRRPKGPLPKGRGRK